MAQSDFSPRQPKPQAIYFSEDNTVNVHMSNLRAKLRSAADGENYIQTVWGQGYRLAPEAA